MYEEIFTFLRKNCKHPEWILTLKLNRVGATVMFFDDMTSGYTEVFQNL